VCLIQNVRGVAQAAAFSPFKFQFAINLLLDALKSLLWTLDEEEESM